MIAKEVERLYRSWEYKWRELEEYVQRRRPTPSQARHFATELLPAKHAEEIQRLTRAHLNALDDYVVALERLENEPAPQQLCSGGGRIALSVNETAEALGLSRQVVYQAIRNGRIPSLKFGGRTVVPRFALERMLSGQGENRR